jgi:hypothetical protein
VLYSTNVIIYREHLPGLILFLEGVSFPNEESGNDESGNDESGNDESGNDESGNDESGNDE